ncbi:unnamed protein product [Linum tenue]|uniref:Uncharacterized protein n=1 Tax=Linum tenue TaxID=586396 RepID=A0AAV0Q5P0_9ROSI|nr:unnamed protein product [Linum tenue]
MYIVVTILYHMVMCGNSMYTIWLPYFTMKVECGNRHQFRERRFRRQ